MNRSLYHAELCKQMNLLAKDPKVIFLGQQVGVEDFYGTLKDIPPEIRIEMPVAEELQMGMSIGLALQGYKPVSIYQRMDFLPRACDQIVNHLDLLEHLSKGRFIPGVIIRVTVGATKPLDVGKQHNKNLIAAFKKMVNFTVVEVKTPGQVDAYYDIARQSIRPIMIVEHQDLYND